MEDAGSHQDVLKSLSAGAVASGVVGWGSLEHLKSSARKAVDEIEKNRDAAKKELDLLYEQLKVAADFVHSSKTVTDVDKSKGIGSLHSDYIGNDGNVIFDNFNYRTADIVIPIKKPYGFCRIK